MQITEHFTLEELCRTDNKELAGANLEAGRAELFKLVKLAIFAEGVRRLLNCPMIITSGYRCPQLNKAIGGSPTSQHLKAQAIDFIPKIMSAGARLIANALSAKGAAVSASDGLVKMSDKIWDLNVETGRSLISGQVILSDRKLAGYQDSWGNGQGYKWVKNRYVFYFTSRNTCRFIDVMNPNAYPEETQTPYKYYEFTVERRDISQGEPYVAACFNADFSRLYVIDEQSATAALNIFSITYAEDGAIQLNKIQSLEFDGGAPSGHYASEALGLSPDETKLVFSKNTSYGSYPVESYLRYVELPAESAGDVIVTPQSFSIDQSYNSYPGKIGLYFGTELNVWGTYHYRIDWDTLALKFMRRTQNLIAFQGAPFMLNGQRMLANGIYEDTFNNEFMLFNFETGEISRVKGPRFTNLSLQDNFNGAYNKQVQPFLQTLEGSYFITGCWGLPISFKADGTPLLSSDDYQFTASTYTRWCNSYSRSSFRTFPTVDGKWILWLGGQITKIALAADKVAGYVLQRNGQVVPYTLQTTVAAVKAGAIDKNTSNISLS